MRQAVLESRVRRMAMMGGGEVELVGGLELCCGAVKCCCCGICWDPSATVMPGMFMICAYGSTASLLPSSWHTKDCSTATTSGLWRILGSPAAAWRSAVRRIIRAAWALASMLCC